jgi:2OG-Fe(II) oxygenase superfamily
MSRELLRERGLVVADGVLPAAAFSALCREVANGDYRSVHTQKWDKAWRLWDGQPLRGESVYFDPMRVFGWKGATYPTSTSVDVLIDAVRRMAAACPDIAGKEGVDWLAIYLSPWLYPIGSALSLHQDAQQYSGSFTFFAHTRWSVHWGGELLVSRNPQAGIEPGSVAHSATSRATVRGGDEPWMSDDGNDDPDDPGIATCVTPKPNRLVLIGPDRPHRVARVDQNAGARVRASIAGFFLRSP